MFAYSPGNGQRNFLQNVFVLCWCLDDNIKEHLLLGFYEECHIIVHFVIFWVTCTSCSFTCVSQITYKNGTRLHSLDYSTAKHTLPQSNLSHIHGYPWSKCSNTYSALVTLCMRQAVAKHHHQCTCICAINCVVACSICLVVIFCTLCTSYTVDSSKGTNLESMCLMSATTELYQLPTPWLPQITQPTYIQ